MNPYQRFIARGSTWIILSILLLGAAAAVLLPKFSIEAGSDVLLNEYDQDLAYYNQTRADWVSDEYVIVCCHRKEGWFSKEGLGLLNSFVRDVRRLPHVKGTTSMLTSVPLLRILPPNMLAPTPIWLVNSKTDELDPRVDLEKAREELLHHTQAVGNLISENGQDASVLVYLAIPDDLTTYEGERNQLLAHGGPGSRERLAVIDPLYQKAKRDLDGRRIELIARLRAMTVEWGPKFDEPLRLSGLSFINILLVEHIRNDLWVFGILSLALFSLTFLLIYRRFRWVALPMITCVLPVAIMLALMVITGKKITIVTSNMPVLLFVLMLPYTVYYIERYRERRTLHPDEPGEFSATRAPIEIWLPCLYSCLATMAGTLAHTPSGINPVRTFGWMMTIGMAVGLGIVMTLLPSANVRLKPLQDTSPGATTSSRGPLKVLETLVLRAPRTVVLFSLAILAVSIWGTSKITVETKFIDYFLKKSPIYQGLDYIDNRMGGTTPLEVILTSDKSGFFKTSEGLAALEASARFFDTVPETGNVRSFKTLLDEVRKAMRGAQDAQVIGVVDAFAGRKVAWKCENGHVKWEGVKEEPRLGAVRTAECKECGRETKQTLDRIEPGLVGEFCNWNFTVSRVLVRMKETAPTLNRNRILGALKTHLASLGGAELKGLEARPTGIFLLYSNMLNTLIKATRETFILAVIAIFLMLCWLFRSPKLAILVLLPQVLPVFLVLGTMGFTGIALDMVTVVIASVSMGVGIDAAIQYTVRFKQEVAAAGGDIPTAVRRSHATIGRAILIATSIVFAGFIILMLSNFKPTIWFGMFTGLAILMGLFASLTTLPATFVLLKYPKK
ncbi:MAG TPA: MMPL family transporter [Planctomycetota bacterium]|nr:MMPL family transporter [Planctomycetota bacterium]